MIFLKDNQIKKRTFQRVMEVFKQHALSIHERLSSFSIVTGREFVIYNLFDFFIIPALYF